MLAYYQQCFSFLVTYTLGFDGLDICPEGYQSIIEPSTCKTASLVLGLNYYQDKDVNKADAICNWCGGCLFPVSRVGTIHSATKPICQSIGN